MTAIGPDVQCIRRDGVVAKVLWIYSSKRGEFYCSILLRLGLLGFSKELGLGLTLALGLCLG